MKLNILTFLLYVFLLSSCAYNTKKLFFIDSFEDLIYMTESANVAYINKENMKLLTSNELMHSKYRYKEYDTIYENEIFKVVIILSLTEQGRNYNFILRTFDKKNGKIIDSFLLSSYNEQIENSFCKGFVTNKLKITRICNDFTIEKQIDTFGRIIEVIN